MNGSVFIINSNGLYCSNDAEFLIESTIVKDDKGNPISSKRNQVIRAMNFMSVSGQLAKEQDVYCQIMFDESGLVQTFSATISAFTEEMIILNLKALNLRHKEVTETIKKKIKEEINHGRS